MQKVIYRYTSIIGIFLVLTLTGCLKKEAPTGPETDQPEKVEIPQKTVSAKVNLPSGSALSSKTLDIISALDSKTTDNQSTVELNTVDGRKQQVLFVTSEHGNPVLLTTVRTSNTESVTNEITAKSTAKSLVLLNPLFLGTTKDQRAKILDKAVSNSNFPGLEQDIKTLLVNDPENVLNYQKHPGIYKEAATIAMDILGRNTQNKAKTYSSEDKTPWVEDVDNDPKVTFFNPRSIYYGVGINNLNQGSDDDVISISAKSSYFHVQLSWPPIKKTDPTETDYDLGDGNFKITMTKGFDFSQDDILDWKTPNGRATISNSGKAFLFIIDLVSGLDITPAGSWAKLIVTSAGTAKTMAALNKDFTEHDSGNIFLDFLSLLSENKGNIGLWLWEDATSDAQRKFVGNLCKVLGGAGIALKVLKASNEALPFVIDLIKAQKTTTLRLSQNGGNLGENKPNTAPSRPNLNASANSISIGAKIAFTATASDPEQDDISYRFNWGDGSYSPWSDLLTSGTDYTLAHAYGNQGEKSVTVEAKDESGAVSETSNPVMITVNPENVYFTYDFDNDVVNQLPSSPPWTIQQNDPSYIQIVQNSSASDLSAAFYDYDPLISSDSSTSSAVIYTNIDSKDKGTVEFSWKVKDQEDSFGLRVWENGWSWDTMGYYVLFINGTLSYYNGDSFNKIMNIDSGRWYNMKLVYDLSNLKYNIYVDGNLEISNVPFVGTPSSIDLLQIVAFSDAQCKTAYIDNIKMTGASLSKQKLNFSEELPANATRISGPLKD